MTITLEKEKDKRRYNKPTAKKEIAIVWDNNQHRDEPPLKPDFVCYPGKGQVKDLKRLSLISPFVEPFSFVLFNPYGGLGWKEGTMLLPLNRGE